MKDENTTQFFCITFFVALTKYKYFGIILFVKGDGTHHKKLLYSTTRGMIPIEKNIVVVDEQGNEYEATYPKRAKGLVKNGRARFIDTGNTRGQVYCVGQKKTVLICAVF